ncbi:glycosyltransferase family 2 protein [Insolitispirillum peregrinum]|uniref:Glycosyltransferase involved in cell wall bisynthesis n=1 Tax=Insolitispirillum peregrinum TaxID=80876 RepID=A0A1N7LD36_9PROT|nr:glycosyltransferase family 2 protein [Insolitispirillum peregrinum]SIS71726.1 Glycosyltransferase involved in cell wall bisynthesis [Insolitispirillum peregrinum]
MAETPTLSALVVAHNEEARLEACLSRLTFADEIVVVLDKTTDGSKAIAERFASRIVEGSWELEGPRRNSGLDACQCDWILEVDADEHVTPELAAEIRATIATAAFDWYVLPVDNYIGPTLVRHGWGSSFGKAGSPSLFRRGIKTWGSQRVHPSLEWRGRKGPNLTTPLVHWVDNDVSDMLRRLDRYTSARARDLCETGNIGSLANALRSGLSRFFRVFVRRKGWKEGRLGLMIAICTALYPIVSHIKAAEQQKHGEPR